MMTSKRAYELKAQKKLLDKITGLGVEVGLDGNEVHIKSHSATNVLLVKNAVLAFNRGFDAAASALLLDEAYDLAIINVGDYAGSQKRQVELKGRVIGSRGLIKKRLSMQTACSIKISGKTISIIGPYQNLSIAVEAVEMLLNGAKHDRVFSTINRRKLEAYSNGNS